MGDVDSRIAIALAQHGYSLGPDGMNCGCGWRRPRRSGDRTLQEVHTEHLGDVLTATLAPALAAEAEVRALRSKLAWHTGEGRRG